MKTIYEADDGEQFDTADECRTYEEEHEFDGLCALDHKRIAEALRRSDVKLADLFEKIGSRISKLRREAGDLRRAPNSQEKAT